MCSRDGYIWKAWLGGQTHLKPPKFGENLRALSEAIGNPTLNLAEGVNPDPYFEQRRIRIHIPTKAEFGLNFTE